MQKSESNRDILKSPSLHPIFGPPFTPKPLFQWYLQSKKFLLTFNAKGLRVIIVAVQVGAVKIYVAAVEALWKKEGQDETQLPPKLLVS
jgi:hypothetical protein